MKESDAKFFVYNDIKNPWDLLIITAFSIALYSLQESWLIGEYIFIAVLVLYSVNCVLCFSSGLMINKNYQILSVLKDIKETPGAEVLIKDVESQISLISEENTEATTPILVLYSCFLCPVLVVANALMIGTVLGYSYLAIAFLLSYGLMYSSKHFFLQTLKNDWIYKE